MLLTSGAEAILCTRPCFVCPITAAWMNRVLSTTELLTVTYHMAVSGAGQAGLGQAIMGADRTAAIFSPRLLVWV